MRRYVLKVLMSVILVLCVFISTFSIANSISGSTPSTWPRFNGSFIQQDLADSFDDDKWDKEFSYMKEAGLTQLFLQWTADSKYKTTVYPSSLSGYTQETTHDLVQMALSHGDSQNIDIYLGLQGNDDWWGNKAKNMNWLNGQANTTNLIFDDLWRKYKSHPSLKGWYISFEPDNWAFLDKSSWDVLASYYKKVCDHIHSISPGKPVAVSPFFNATGGLNPSQWQTMWAYILKKCSLDIIALQDGTGTNDKIQRLPEWFSATQNAIKEANSSTLLWSDTENFMDEIRPMDVSTFVNAMQTVKPYVSNFLSFSYNHYTSPQQVSPIYNQTYLDYLQNQKVEEQAPSVPLNMTASAVDDSNVNLSWSTSTDNIGVAGYKIYRDDVLIKLVFDTAQFSDTQLNPETTYKYKVKAFDAAGNTSDFSNEASVTTTKEIIYPNNIALGKTYTVSMAANSKYPDSGKELTDGVYGRFDLSDKAWQGRGTSSPYSIIVDLGTKAQIKEIKSNWMQYNIATVLLPERVNYYVSDDNKTYSLVATITQPVVSDDVWSQKYKAGGLNVSGRYVKVEVAAQGWSFIDEIEIRN